MQNRYEYYGSLLVPPNTFFFVLRFQTLIVLSDDPETIFDPSGEKSTDQITSLCALAFSVLSSSVAIREARKRQFRRKNGDFGPKIAPESQTLSVPSAYPAVIHPVSPSKTATLFTSLAPPSSSTSSSVAASYT